MTPVGREKRRKEFQFCKSLPLLHCSDNKKPRKVENCCRSSWNRNEVNGWKECHQIQFRVVFTILDVVWDSLAWRKRKMCNQEEGKLSRRDACVCLWKEKEATATCYCIRWWISSWARCCVDCVWNGEKGFFSFPRVYESMNSEKLHFFLFPFYHLVAIFMGEFYLSKKKKDSFCSVLQWST